MADTRDIDSVSTVRESIRSVSRDEVHRVLGAARGPAITDAAALADLIAAARRSPTRSTVRWFHDITRTTIRGDNVADIGTEDLGGALPQPPDGATVPSPYDPRPEVAAPLLTAIGRLVRAPDALTAVQWPPLTLASVIDAYIEKQVLPTGDVILVGNDHTAETAGCTIDVSTYAMEIMQTTGRSSFIVDFMAASTLTAVEEAIVAALAAAISAGTPGDTPSYTFPAPWAARVVAGSASRLLTMDPLALDAVGLRLVASGALGDDVYVLDPRALDVVYTALQVQATIEPERNGINIGVSMQFAAQVPNPEGVSRAVPAMTP